MIITIKNDTESDVTLDDGTVIEAGKSVDVPADKVDEILAVIFAAGPIGGKKEEAEQDSAEAPKSAKKETENEEEKKDEKKDEQSPEEQLEAPEDEKNKKDESMPTPEELKAAAKVGSGTKGDKDPEDEDEEEKRRRLEEEEEEKKKKAACKEHVDEEKDVLAEEREAIAAERKALMEEKAQLSFDKFCAEGKLVPSQKEAFMALAGQSTEVAYAEGKSKPVAELLNEFVESAPAHSLYKEEGAGGDGDPKPELTADEKEVAATLGISEKELLKSKEKENQYG